MDRTLSAQSQRLNKVLHHIDCHLGGDLSLDEISQVSGWSRWQLQRVFQAHTGLSVAQYIRQLRMSQSATQLLSTEKRHLDIALSAGFESEATFSRAFRQHFQCTPRQYRKAQIPSGIRFPLEQVSNHSIRLELREAFTLEGDYCETYGLYSPKADFAEKIPQHWQAMHGHFDPLETLLAVIDVGDPVDGRLRYWVGKTTDHPLTNPSLKHLHVPRQLYAVVSHIGDLATLPDTINWFILHWLSHSPYEAFEGFDIEEYQNFTDDNSGIQQVDYWIPIRQQKHQQ